MGLLAPEPSLKHLTPLPCVSSGFRRASNVRCWERKGQDQGPGSLGWSLCELGTNGCPVGGLDARSQLLSGLPFLEVSLPPTQQRIRGPLSIPPAVFGGRSLKG